MISRCEYVDEFAGVQEEAGRPARDFLEKIERIYRRAADKGMLREGLGPQEAARDTWAFTSGILHLLLGCQMDGASPAANTPDGFNPHGAASPIVQDCAIETAAG
jgi:TetR/AcrR family acrAB operon transcriptional repressor